MLYQRKNDLNHFIWETSTEEMVKDKIYQEMQFKKVELPYLGGIETPIVLRALRAGVMLKLEDLYMPFIQGVDMVASTIKS